MVFAAFQLILFVRVWTASLASNEPPTGSVISQGDCVDGPSHWYRGGRNYTVSGTACQRWDSDTPHVVRYKPQDGAHHNHCRNPDRDLGGTWCYTMNATKRWEYCRVPKCADDSLLVWTNYEEAKQGSSVLSMKADPEVVKQEAGTGIFNVEKIVQSNVSMTEYWTVASDYANQRLFFTDYRSEYVGVVNLEKKTTTTYFEGMAHGIENIEFDWMTGNLYWSDSELKWIMVVDSTFQFYTPIYRSVDPIYGLAIHAKLRKIYFATYRMMGSKISIIDLAGKNETVLRKFPDVYDVTGITIDYTDDRLYWTDFTGWGGMVMSCRLDGTNVTRHQHRLASIFWGLASYLDYLFVTDVHARHTPESDKFYYLWVILKSTPPQSQFSYTLEGKPRGIAIYSDNEDRSYDAASRRGACESAAACDHICLPRANASRECACSMGYHKPVDDDTRCVSDLAKDQYLLLCDYGQGRIFQIPFHHENPNFYSFVPVGGLKTKASTVMVDVVSEYVYWSDQSRSEIHKAVSDGSRQSNLAKGKHAYAMELDPQTNNVYFVDDQTQAIMVMNENGGHIRTVVRHHGQQGDNRIRKLAIDVRYKHLYWTENGVEGMGQIWRVKLDGTDKQLILDLLHWPNAITVDQQRRSLFYAEAKAAQIYEIPLTSLQNIRGRNTSQPFPHHVEYDLTENLDRVLTYILEIKVNNHELYLVDTRAKQLERFNLTSGVSSKKKFGPAEFFQVTSIAIFSKLYLDRYIAPLRNPCYMNRCSQICVPMSEYQSRCICEDGEVEVYGRCIVDPGASTNTPPTTDNCPSDVIRKITPCTSTPVLVEWEPPTWTDDTTPAEKLQIRTNVSSSTQNLMPGKYTLHYTAVDEYAAEASCIFTVIVEAVKCKEQPVLPSSMQASAAWCDDVYLTYDVTCRNDDVIAFNSTPVWFLIRNRCSYEDGDWAYMNFSLFTCTYLGPETELDNSTKVEVDRVPATREVEVIEISPTHASNNSTSKERDERKWTKKSGLGLVPIVAVSVVVALLVIAILFYITLTRSGIAWVSKMNLPAFWRRKEDTVDLQQRAMLH